MVESTFLGTPLTKHDIDDVGIRAGSRRAKSYLEAKELKRRQNRELIRKNKIKTLYTVDTEEGWTPSEFVSSRTKRANYTFQTRSNFTDEDDADIVSMNVLNNLKIKEKEMEINRIIKAILNDEGYLIRVYGPQLPPNRKHYTVERDLKDLRGVGYREKLEAENRAADREAGSDDSEGEDTKGRAETKLKWVAVDGTADKELFPKVVSDLGVRPENLKTYHTFDRDRDLEDIRGYYKSYFDYIVKPLEKPPEESVEDLYKKYTNAPEFINVGSNQATPSADYLKYKETKEREETTPKYPHNFKGRTVTRYKFAEELLAKFKIKAQFRERSPPPRPAAQAAEEEIPVDLPPELFYNLFGKPDK